MKKITFIALLSLSSLIYLNMTYAGESQEDKWSRYIDGSVGKQTFYVYNLVKNSYFIAPEKYRALDLGSGAGNEDIDMLSRGWDVQSIDVSERSGEVIQQQANLLSGHFSFQQGDFPLVKLHGYYDLVISFFALPFGNKKDFPVLLKNISRHMKPGSIWTSNFFGYEHTYVKQNNAYGMSDDEVKSVLINNGLKPVFFLHRLYPHNDFSGNQVDWDEIDVIAVKQ